MNVKTLSKEKIVQHYVSIHLRIVFATVMVILNVNLAVVAIKQFVSHNVHVGPVVQGDALVGTQLNSATYVQVMSALTSRTLC